MDNRPSSLLIGNYVAVAAVGDQDRPPQTSAFGVRVGLITDLNERYVVMSFAILSLL